MCNLLMSTHVNTYTLIHMFCFQVTWVTIYRVCGEISVTRSIGDPDYKTFVPGAKLEAFFLWPDGHDQVTIAVV
jgi:hypothetical protein